MGKDIGLSNTLWVTPESLAPLRSPLSINAGPASSPAMVEATELSRFAMTRPVRESELVQEMPNASLFEYGILTLLYCDSRCEPQGRAFIS